MRVDDFDFDLPEEAIALRPLKPRDSAKMLVVKPGETAPFSDHRILDLPNVLRPGDAVVFNDTRVIPAQLSGIRRRLIDGEMVEAGIGVTLHMRTAADTWHCFARPAKKLAIDDEISFQHLKARVVDKLASGDIVLKFDASGPDLDVAIAEVGIMPLPPYISGKRGQDEADIEDYQTVYAREPGAVAAPTAGLHTTEKLIKSLKERGCSLHYVTLHVGAGTFLPVKADDTDDHQMHAEIGVIDEETAAALNATRKAGGRIVAVGTTSLRLLESAALPSGEIAPFSAATDIFITPGYQFRAVDLLMTNFHLPRSTLFMLVSAFCGLEVMRDAYQHAIQNRYRFYSYGDGSLLQRADLPTNLR